jgi:hypothetical protein
LLTLIGDYDTVKPFPGRNFFQVIVKGAWGFVPRWSNIGGKQ